MREKGLPEVSALYQAGDLEYRVVGSDLQAVEVHLPPGEAVVSEAGAFLAMEEGITMETILGDGSPAGGGFLRRVGRALMRNIFTGESLFMTLFQNESDAIRRIWFAGPYPGKIVPVHLNEVGGEIICQKDAFLCARRGVRVDVVFHRKIGAGLFGGEGFFLQKISGDTVVFIHAGGTVIEKDLDPGEVLRLDTGCLVAFTAQVDYDIEFIRGKGVLGTLKNWFFGGEGLLFATLKGPGKVWIQTFPFSRLADRIIQAARSLGGKSKGEGSVLGGLFDAIGGD